MMRAVVVIAALCGACRARPADCPGERLDDGVVAVFEGSRVRWIRPGAAAYVELGPPADCERGGAHDAFVAARAAIAVLGDAAPNKVQVVWRPRVVSGAGIDRIEVVEGVVLVESVVPVEVWVHELVHVAVEHAPRRSFGPLAAQPLPVVRLRAAAEEGVADFIASSRVGPIDRPPAANAASADWSALGLADLRFDPHPLGERFAAALARRPVAARCLIDLLARGDGETPAALVADWKRLCPESSEPLDAWIPAPLRESLAPGREVR